MRYTSELTDSQWEIIKPILQEARYRSIEEKREQARTDECGILLGENRVSMEELAKRFS